MVSIVVKIVLGIVVLCVVLDKTFTPIVRITGNSMNPTYEDGEHILSHRVFDRSKLKVGEVVVFVNPSTYGHKMLIKRIDKFDVLKSKVWLLGDNIEDSYDSREFGWCPIENVRYKILVQRPVRKVV